MSKKLNVRTDNNVHGTKNPHYTNGDAHVEASHLDVLLTMPLFAALLAVANRGLAEKLTGADEVFAAAKRICRSLIFVGIKDMNVTPKEYSDALATLVSLGFPAPAIVTEVVATTTPEASTAPSEPIAPPVVAAPELRLPISGKKR